jgi:hypothetical protein
MTIAAAGGPSWADILTAIGTVGAVVVAVWIALRSERKSDKRMRAERTRSDTQLAEQRALDKAAIEDERAHGRAQLEEERQLAREREQLAGAYAVQVVLGEAGGETTEFTAYGDPKPPQTKLLAVMVVNRSPYTITRVEVRFCLGRSLIQHHRYERVSSLDAVPGKVRHGFRPSAERPLSDVLTPFDEGIRFETDEIHEKYLSGPYPVVRWKDHWGTFWEHKRGVVRQVTDGQPWEL